MFPGAAVAAAAVPPADVCADEGIAEPLYTVPTETFSILISLTGVSDRTILNVLSSLLSFLHAIVCSSVGEGF